MRGGSAWHERSRRWIHVAAPADQVGTATQGKHTRVSREPVTATGATCVSATQTGMTDTYLKCNVRWVNLAGC